MAGSVPQRLTALLVEDNEIHATVIRRHLGKGGREAVRLEHVERLQPALQRLGEGGIDAVLLDLGLPDSRITETLPQLIQAGVDVPIVVLTSLNDLEFAASAVQQGAQDFLVKSDLNGELLLRSIRYAIERKKTQDKIEAYASELERSNEELKGFCHTLAHEVKSPLTVVKYCLEVLQEKYGSQFDREAEGFVGEAGSAVRGMTDLVNQLLDFARVGSPTPQFAEVDMEAVFFQANALLRPAIKQSGASVTHDPLPTVLGEAVQLRHLLQNLLSNAVKYRSERPPEIHLAAEPSGSDWTFTVRDNGLGVAPEDQQRIFEVFARAHVESKIPGTGIGLAFCKRIVEHHRGKIWVESELGAGSTFRFTLPQFQFQTGSRDRGQIDSLIRR